MAFLEIHEMLLVLTTSFKTGGTVGRSNSEGARGINTRFCLSILLFVIKWFLLIRNVNDYLIFGWQM